MMDMSDTKQAKLPVNSIRICFRKRRPECFQGWICGVACKDMVEFYDAADLIIKIDSTYNQIGHPQPHQILRSFGETDEPCAYCGQPERYHTDEEIKAMHGEEGTFEMLMLTRHSAEWQGMLTCMDSGKRGKFATTLECIRLLNEGLRSDCHG